MNILQIVPQLNLGGVERGVLDFSNYLIQNGHKSVVVSSGGRLVDSLDKSGAVHYTLPVQRKSLFSVLSSIREVKKIILKEKIDIVHCRSRVPDWIGFFATLKTPAQFIVTAHGYYSTHFFSKIVSLAKFVISPSKAVALHLVEDLKVPSSKVSIISRGLNLSEFSFLKPSSRSFEEIKLCFLGRISPIKGVEYFIEAIDNLLKSLPNVKAFIVGEASKKHKEYELFLKRKVLRAGLAEKIEFLGRRNSSEILENCHILVLPSLIPESFGRAVIEAQAKGVLCIATNLGGPSEIIKDGLTGFLVPPYDSLAIAQKAKKALLSKELYNKIVYNARRQVEEKYTLEKMSEATIRVYSKSLSRLNILVIKISSLGDVVLGTASFRSLKENFPNSYLSVLCRRSYFKIIEDLDFVDEIIIYEDKASRFKELIRLSNILRKKSFDIIVDLQNNHFSHLLSYLIFPKKSIGFDRKFGFLLDERIDFKLAEKLGPLGSQEALLSILGIKDIKGPQLKVDGYSLASIEDILKEEGIKPQDKLAGINIEASSKWKTKNLKEERLRELINYLIKDKKLKVVLIGEANSFEKTERLKEVSFENIVNFCGRTNLKQLVALISKMSIFITPDSAPFHIALSLNIPTLGIFGPTDPKKHTFLKEGIFIVQKKIKCLGCYKKHCRTTECMDIGLDEFSPVIDEIIH